MFTTVRFDALAARTSERHKSAEALLRASSPIALTISGHERRRLALDAKLGLEVAEKVAKVDVEQGWGHTMTLSLCRSPTPRRATC